DYSVEEESSSTNQEADQQDLGKADQDTEDEEVSENTEEVQESAQQQEEPSKEESGNAVSGNTIIENEHKTIKTFSPDEVETMTGYSVDVSNIDNIYSAFENTSTWTDGGFTEEEADLIASGVSSYSDSVKGKLRGMANAKGHKSFKVIIIKKQSYTGVEFGLDENN
ncbi:MAG TPA: hypothetical protein IAC62_15170, partial [Candidatus Pelethocola excrementipullorum]|nr:hypothetical protein [Candidatus Pelethocola excrementipullorum]